MANLYAANEGGGVRLYWDGVQAEDVAGYELRAGSDGATGQRIAQVGREVREFTVSPSIIAQTGNSRYFIKAFTTSRVYSPAWTSKSHAHPWIHSLSNSFRQFGGTNQRF